MVRRESAVLFFSYVFMGTLGCHMCVMFFYHYFIYDEKLRTRFQKVKKIRDYYCFLSYINGRNVSCLALADGTMGYRLELCSISLILAVLLLLTGNRHIYEIETK